MARPASTVPAPTPAATPIAMRLGLYLLAALAFATAWMVLELGTGAWLPWMALLAALGACLTAHLLRIPRGRSGAVWAAVFVLLACLLKNYGLAALLLGGELGLDPLQAVAHGSPGLILQSMLQGNTSADGVLYLVAALLAAIWRA